MRLRAPLGPLLAALLVSSARGARPAPAVQLDTSDIVRPAGPAASFSVVVAKAAPAVVSIVSEAGRPGFWPEPRRPEGGQASGVLVSPDGFILTNSHVARDGARITVSVPGRAGELPAKVVGRDPKADLALLKIEGEGFPAAVFADSGKLAIGDLVLAIGNPFGIGQTVTMGIVSATGRGNIGIEDYEDFIQTDAAINPGNSGGALIDAQGRLVGLNTAILSPTGGNLGIGFAVPANLARSIMESLALHGKVVRGFLGAVIQDVSPGLARRFGVEAGRGALIGEVSEGGPAEKAGLRSGDIVVALDAKPVKDSRSLRLAISQKAPGTKVSLGFVRDGKQQAVVVALGTLPEEKEPGAESGEPGTAPPGLALDDLTDDIARQLDAPATLRGAVVSDVEPGSGAERAGLHPGDVVVEVERKAVRSAREAETALGRVRGPEALLRVWSRGGYHFVALPLGQHGG